MTKLGLAPYGKSRRFALEMIEPDGSCSWSRINYLTRSNAQDAGRRWKRQRAGRRFRTQRVWA